ncbi:hypothetical protein [Micromonospora sp. bgisy143]|uniref:hypothetical protein n=1 Tax=Micromonospora sp. bgisy143 TaxID=3413790 RepID=UPI003EB8D1FD
MRLGRAVRLLSPREGAGPHRRWFDTLDTRQLDLRPLALFQPRRGYTPDFLSPPPVSPRARFEDPWPPIGTPLWDG